MTTLCFVACSAGDGSDDSSGSGVGTGGATAGTGGAASGGFTATGGVATGGTGVGGTGGVVSTGGVSTGGVSTGGANTGGLPATGGAPGGGGSLGSGGDPGSGGGPGTGGSGGFTPSTGPARSLGYLGCSMSVNVAEGYEMQGGERLWPPIGQYNGQVVQNWANNGDAVWSAFDNAVNQYGEPEAVWVMLCIFNNMVTLDEAKQIVGNVRSRVPNATIYITGQPLYDDPNSCFLAGNGGPDLTDSVAQQAAADPSLNVVYPGSLGPLGSDQNTDGCHANDNGRLELGQQFIDWFGD